ncbi:MAG: sigma-54 dependent transcriptional regulator [Myxococcales bacterium]|nr:sigma-54 dependent transcriptional regulator [Myxococcales bacterium]
MPRILVVDDEAGVQASLRMLLKNDCEVATAASVDEALRSIAEAPPDLILLDLVMPGRGGLDLLAEISEQPSSPPVVVLTATKTVSSAVEAMKRGAVDYVTKPFEVESLRIKVRQLLERRALEHEVARLRARVEGQERLGDLLGRSEPMQEVFHTLRRVAVARATVLIRGESGTGKELAAHAIHDLSPRRERPFVAVNCAAIPETLIESELFGHERGAFTDAVDRRIGRFEAASGGTLFFDEIGELSSGVQAKLLRALQERRIERVGSTRTIDVDVRVIAATNRDLDREVAERRFREDLYYRINVVPVALPPLRERREDVRLLASHFFERSRAEAGRPGLELASEVIAALERYPWPGNVRELENAIEHAVALCEGDVVRLDDLPQAVVRAGRIEDLRQAVHAGRLGFEQASADFERELLLEALERTGWNQTRTAEQLRVTRRALKLKMDRYGLKPPA